MLQFGFSLVPSADLGAHREVVAAAEDGGLDLVGIQDHPYARQQVDTFSLLAMLLSHTSRIRMFPDVASLPLRPAAMLAEVSATLDLLSGGRFELGLGAGGNWDAIEAMGAARLTPGQAVNALEEAIAVLRAMWTDGPARVDGTYHSVAGLRPGPMPAHPINIWVGSLGQKTFELTGRLADGWAAPIAPYMGYEKWAGANVMIDKAASAAGRDPADVLRMAQIVGTITDTQGDSEAQVGSAPVRGTPDQWAALIARLATEQPFRCFIFWPEEGTVDQVERFARQVVPAARELLGT